MKYYEMFKTIFNVPQNTCNNGDLEKWEKYEKEMNIIFPKDYKKFINEYGTGTINNFFWFLTPFDEDNNINYSIKSKEMISNYLMGKEMMPEYYTYEMYPKKGGLLPWGYTENGDELYWKTEENMDKWKIVVCGSGPSDALEYDMSFSEFLYKYFKGELICEALPDSLLEEVPYFVSV